MQLLTVLIIYVGCSGVLCELSDFRLYESSCPSPSSRTLKRNPPPDWGSYRRAVHTLPREVSLDVSAIPNANLGIIANTFIPRFTWLGNYEGDVVVSLDDISDYAWSIHRGGVRSHYIDGGELERSNWLRWINCPRHRKEENVWMTWCLGHVYYITSKDVRPGEELLVYYGDGYAKHLGINVDAYYSHAADVAKCSGTMVCCKDQVVMVA